MKDKPAFKRGLLVFVVWLVWFFSGAAYGFGANPANFSLSETTPAFKIFFTLWAAVSVMLLFYSLKTLIVSFRIIQAITDESRQEQDSA